MFDKVAPVEPTEPIDSFKHIPVKMSLKCTVCTFDVCGHKKQRKSKLVGGLDLNLQKFVNCQAGLTDKLYVIPHLNSQELCLTNGAA